MVDRQQLIQAIQNRDNQALWPILAEMAKIVTSKHRKHGVGIHDVGDLRQELVMYAMGKLPTADRSDTAFPYILQVMRRRLAKLAGRAREKMRHADDYADRQKDLGCEEETAEAPEPMAGDLAMWLRDLRIRSDRNSRTLGRCTYTRGQAIAVASLACRRQLSSRGVVALITESEPIRSSLGMVRAPSWRQASRWISTYRRKILVSSVPSATMPTLRGHLTPEDTHALDAK